MAIEKDHAPPKTITLFSLNDHILKLVLSFEEYKYKYPAIEANVDLVTLEYHRLAKIAKDCGSAASFVMSIVAVHNDKHNKDHLKNI